LHWIFTDLLVAIQEWIFDIREFLREAKNQIVDKKFKIYFLRSL